MTPEGLLAEARAAASNAYAPYSRFRVGAALVGDDGVVYTGANVENAAYPSALCAETVAIGHAVASGVRAIGDIAVVCLDGSRPCYPCGQCRQRMREFDVERLIVDDGAGGARIHDFASEILPNSFGPRDLTS